MVNFWKPLTAALAGQVAAAPTITSNGSQSRDVQSVSDRRRVQGSAAAVGPVAKTFPTVQYGTPQNQKRTATDGCGPNAWRKPTGGCFTLGNAIGVGVGIGLVVLICVGCGVKVCYDMANEHKPSDGRTWCDRCLGRKRKSSTANPGAGASARSPADLRTSAQRTAAAPQFQSGPYGVALPSFPPIYGGHRGSRPPSAQGPTYPAGTYTRS